MNGAVRPGRPIRLAGERPLVARTVLRCHEARPGETRRWLWIFLEDGSLLEDGPAGRRRYRRHLVIPRGSDLYETLVAQDGALVRFEDRVQRGIADRRPVHVTFDGLEYRLVETGAVAATPEGDPPGLAPWRSLRDDPRENVYARMRATDGHQIALALWTDDLCISFGA